MESLPPETFSAAAYYLPCVALARLSLVSRSVAELVFNDLTRRTTRLPLNQVEGAIEIIVYHHRLDRLFRGFIHPTLSIFAIDNIILSNVRDVKLFNEDVHFQGSRIQSVNTPQIHDQILVRAVCGKYYLVFEIKPCLIYQICHCDNFPRPFLEHIRADQNTTLEQILTELVLSPRGDDTVVQYQGRFISASVLLDQKFHQLTGDARYLNLSPWRGKAPSVDEVPNLAAARVLWFSQKCEHGCGARTAVKK
jgi:hypothetical protein